MRSYQRVFLTVVAVFIANVLFAKEYKFDTVPSDPLKTRIYELENGLKVYLSDNKDAPTIQTYIGIASGSKNDPSETTGLAHYLEHMLFKGTDKFGTWNWEAEEALLKNISDLYESPRLETAEDKKREIYNQIDVASTEAAQYAVPDEHSKMLYSFGGSESNAWTSVEETVYQSEIPSNAIEQWASLESERFRKLVLRLFHTELEAVYEEFNIGQDEDVWQVYDGVSAALF